MATNNEFLLDVVTDIEKRLVEIFNEINIKEQIEVELRECGKFGLNSSNKDILKIIDDLVLSSEGKRIFSEYKETAQEEGSPTTADDKSTDQPDRPLTQATPDLEPTAARTGRAPDSAARIDSAATADEPAAEEQAALAAEEQAALAAEEQATLAAWLEGRAAEDLYLIEAEQALEVLKSISTSRRSVSAVQENDIKDRIKDAKEIKGETKELQGEIDKMISELKMDDGGLEKIYKESDTTRLDELRKDKMNKISNLLNYTKLSEIMDSDDKDNQLAELVNKNRVELMRKIARNSLQVEDAKKAIISLFHSKKLSQPTGGGKKKRTYKKKKKRRSQKKRTPMKRKKTPMKKKVKSKE